MEIYPPILCNQISLANFCLFLLLPRPLSAVVLYFVPELELSSRVIVVSFKALEDMTATLPAIFINQGKMPSQQISSFIFSSFFRFFSIICLILLRDHVAFISLLLSSNQRQSVVVTCLMNDNKSRLKNTNSFHQPQLLDE